jgi:hypothetical protein
MRQVSALLWKWCGMGYHMLSQYVLSDEEFDSVKVRKAAIRGPNEENLSP